MPRARRRAEPLELARRAPPRRFGVRARVQLHDRRAGARRARRSARVGIDEQRHADASLARVAARGRHVARVRGHVEPALGRELCAPLGHEAAVRRPHARTAMSSIASVTAISRFMRVCSSGAKHRDVALLDVPAILAQVHRDAVRAGLLGDQRGVTGSG